MSNQLIVKVSSIYRKKITSVIASSPTTDNFSNVWDGIYRSDKKQVSVDQSIIEMISLTKSSKQSVSSSAVMERRKREKERNKLSMKRKLPSDAKSRFGKEFFGKLCELFQSVEQDSCDRLRQMHDELAAYYKEHDLNVMWISDDEADGKEVKAPLSKKTHQDVNKGDMRSINISRSKLEAKEKLKPKSNAKNSVANASPIPTSLLLSQFELSDDSDDSTSRKFSGPQTKNCKICYACNGATSLPNNMILDCEECGKTIHQKCARPEITASQAKDPRFLFVCNDCKDRDDEKMGSSYSKSTNFRKVDDKGNMRKSSEERIQPLKPENDILVTFSNFAAKKAKKSASSGASGSSNLQVGSVTMNKNSCIDANSVSAGVRHFMVEYFAFT
uniref:PHD-type domain-containing protein n=1 Tax=Elaeophora elaphi TaxID=1147741 RepID=A0A0R3RSW9_9BILA